MTNPLHISIGSDAVASLYTLPIEERNLRAYELFHSIVEVESFKCHSKLTYVGVDDLQGAGYLGLYKALNTYIVGRCNFVSYCWHSIHGYMLNLCKKEVKNRHRYSTTISSLTGARLDVLVKNSIGIDDTITRSLILGSDSSYYLPLLRVILSRDELFVLTSLYIRGVSEVSIASSLGKCRAKVRLLLAGALVKVNEAIKEETLVCTK